MSATLVSVCPFALRESKPTLTPFVFELEAAQPGDISILVIDKVWADRYIQAPSGEGVNERFLEDSMSVAQAIIRDFAQAQLVGIHNSDCQPGLFAVEGAQTKDKIKNEFKVELRKAHAQHKKFCLELVKLADDDWQKYRQHRMITDRQREAAKYLNLQRDWLLDPDDVNNIKCPFCRSFIPAESLVCNNCSQVVDQVGFDKAKNIKIAEMVGETKVK